MSETRTIKSLMALLSRKRVALAKLRDELRDLEAEVSSLAYDTSEAIEHLEDATDALSRLV